MPIDFYYTPLSPPCKTVYMVLEELGLEHTDHDLDLRKGEHKTAQYAELNPRQKVPALRDDSLSVGESRAIACYLCNEYGAMKNKKNLYPTDPRTRAKVDQMLYIDVDWWESIVSYVNVRGVFLRNEKTKVENVGNVTDVLAACNKFLSEKKYIAADHLTIADFAIYNTLSLLNITNFNDYDAYPKVVSWKKTISQLPYHKKICEEPEQKFRALYLSKLEE